MAQAIGQISPFNPGNIRNCGFDFTSELADADMIDVTVDPVVTFTVASGTDPDFASHLINAPQIQGSKVIQKLGNFVLLTIVVYVFSIAVKTIDGEDLNLWGYVAAGPVGSCGVSNGC